MSVEELEKAVAALPPEKLKKFSAWFEAFAATRSENSGSYSASEEELHGIDRGLRDCADGKFVSAEEIEATFAKHRVA